LTALAGKHQLMIVWTPGSHSPGPKIRSKGREQAHCAVLASLGVGLLS
jgi:hypothetical protein